MNDQRSNGITPSHPPSPSTARPFTGWHATAMLVAFFGVVIGVNLFMARTAVSSFGGTVVDNSYVASQNFNDWLAAAKEQEKLGWTVTAQRATDNHIGITTIDASGPLTGARVSAKAEHPLGRLPTVDLSMTEVAPGQWRSAAALPNGRWTVKIEVKRGENMWRSVEALR